MAFQERITLLVDVVTGNAKKQFEDLKKAMTDADGVVNTIKAGWKGLGDIIQKNSMAVVAGGAAAGAGIFKLASSFTDAALAAGKFGDATGLGVEDASRFIEVAGDLGIEAGTLEGALNRMNRVAATSPDKFEKIGAAIVRAKDGSVDVRATFLNVTDALNRIPSASDRAQAATDLLGRGWTNLAELIAEGSSSINASLDAVNDGIAIDEDELEKAKRFRDTLDQLKDSGEEAKLTFGEAAADSFSRFFQILNGGVGVLDALNSKLMESVIGGALGNIGGVIDNISGKVNGSLRVGVQGLSGDLDAGQVSAGGWGAAIDAAAAQAEAGVNDVSGAYAFLKGQLSEQSALIGLEGAFADVEAAAVDAFTSAANGEDNAAAEARRHQAEVVSLKQKVVQYGEQIGKLPPQKVSNILALIDQGKLAEAKAALDAAARPRLSPIAAQVLGISAANAALDSITRTRNANVNVNIIQRGGAGYGPSGVPRASGGAVVPGGLYQMGENGPEAVSWDAAGRGRVTPAGATARMMGGGQAQTVVHVHVAGSVVSERQLIDAVHQGLIAKQRRSGGLGLVS